MLDWARNILCQNDDVVLNSNNSKTTGSRRNKARGVNSMDDSQDSNGDEQQSTATIKSAIIPIDEHLDDLAFNVAQALLRRAKGSEHKAMVCQNQIQFWRGQMLVIAEKDEYSTKQSSSSSSVFVTDDDCDSSSIYSNEDITTTSSSTIVKEV
jgi:hypothetical protein